MKKLFVMIDVNERYNLILLYKFLSLYSFLDTFLSPKIYLYPSRIYHIPLIYILIPSQTHLGLFKIEPKPKSRIDKKVIGLYYWVFGLVVLMTILIFFIIRLSVLNGLKFFLNELTDNPIVN